jgi:glyoxylase-like metal-dependent hydrolase (beta-lactamase superfamily II)
MAHLTEAEPVRGVLLPAASGISRIVAPNPSPMTYHGTNTYLIAAADGTSIVVDPGPCSADHVAAVLDAAGRVSRIFVTHAHHDHVGALQALRAATGAPVYAFDAGVEPDHRFLDGVEVAGWTVLHTPGHAADHVCLARADGVVFSADHIMGWSTSVVGDDMADYIASLRRMLARDDRLYLPGHGPSIANPAEYTQFLLDHRLAREAAILVALARGPQAIDALVDALYVGLEARLKPMAGRSVAAHLGKLRREGRAVEAGAVWSIP